MQDEMKKAHCEACHRELPMSELEEVDHHTKTGGPALVCFECKEAPCSVCGRVFPMSELGEVESHPESEAWGHKGPFFVCFECN